METCIIKTPSAELRVVDLGRFRQITVKGKARHHAKLQVDLDTIETTMAVNTLETLVKEHGDWWLDEVERRQDADYLRRRIETLMRRFGGLSGARILDMGSGSGSSAFVLLDLGASAVQGIEPNAKLVDIAVARAEDEPLGQQSTFTCIQDTSKLPFEDGRFDIVTFNAVLEHIPPKSRTAVLQEAWRCLKPGGLMVFTETPNRAFPYDGHTTGLPILPWLPIVLAYPLARLLSRHVPRGLSKDSYIAQGLVGGSYWQIKHAIPDAVCLNAKGGDAEWKILLRPSYRWLEPILKVKEWILNRFGLPLNAFMPMMDLVWSKRKDTK